MPALGMQWIGFEECSPRKRTASRMSSGPVEQLRPMTSTVERLERGQRGADVGAEQHLAAVGQQRDGGLDRHGAAGRPERLAGAEHGGLDLEDVLRGLDDDQVDAALEQAAACSRRPRRGRGSGSCPSVGSSEAGRKPVGPIEPATKRSSPTALRAISRPCG
jgi:hypothetical protein